MELSEHGPAAAELERRVVLSQYSQRSSVRDLPPQETGLTCNSWAASSMEMHWWHAAQYLLWNRTHLRAQPLVVSVDSPKGERACNDQDTQGRWPKMGSEGDQSLSPSLRFSWQQPHPIFSLSCATGRGATILFFMSTET